MSIPSPSFVNNIAVGAGLLGLCIGKFLKRRKEAKPQM